MHDPGVTPTVDTSGGAGSPAGDVRRHAPQLLGRRAECETLDRLLADVVAGSSRVLVLRGEAGVGKTALLGHLTERTKDWRVTCAVGVESGMELASRALHQVCSPLLEHLPALPAPQQDALATALGLRPGPTPDRFLVALATLTLIAEAAEDRPLACVVDDAQWLDSASAQALAFVARRLVAERVALVGAVRTGSGDDVLQGLPALELRGLGDGDARTLLLATVPASLDAAVADRLVAESRGNPLALLELPRTWTSADVAGGFGLPHTSPVAGRIEQSFARRVQQLPAPTQLLVLAAAAEPVGDPGLLARAAEHLGLGPAALAPAVDDRLLALGRRVTFTHPLVRSAAYRTAAAGDRLRVHAALAEATDARTDPDRRAWHRARATAGPDEGVAAELESSAGRARARGGLAAAAAFLTRAAELTPDPARRVRRALDAAFAGVQAGAFDTARALLALVDQGPVDELQRARSDLLRAQLAFANSRGNEAAPLLLAAARRLEPVDAVLARDTYLDALTAALFVAGMAQGADLHEVARAARAAPRPAQGGPGVADLLLDALAALLTTDDETAFPRSRAALQRLSADDPGAQTRTRWLWLGTAVASDLWDDESWYVLSDRYLRTARQSGALTELPHALNSRATILLLCGETAAAASLVDEARSVQEATGIRTAPYGALALSAWQGRESLARELIGRTITESTARGEGWGVAFSEYARALLCNGLGRHDEALAAARAARERSRNRAGVNLALPELVEAATRTGRAGPASDAVQLLVPKARASGTDWALGIAARTQAQLSEGDAAEDRYRAAIEHLSRTRVRSELARAHLLYGEWLRTTDRPADARAQLTTAHEMFTGMGLEGFAGRARRELMLSGATVPHRPARTRDDLTAQEAHIARLAREGLSNPEIGAELFLSARTVEWHLRKVFTKLGITSRRQLRRPLPHGGGSAPDT